MTQEEKQLLLQDLCARLPYGVVYHRNDGANIKLNAIDVERGLLNYTDDIEERECKPYLRPMSSMTEEEIFQLGRLTGAASYNMLKGDYSSLEELLKYVYKNHIDYFGLISRSIALEAKEDMYK